MLTDEEVVLMRRIMADALTIKPGERAVEYVPDNMDWAAVKVTGEWSVDSYSGETICECIAWNDTHDYTDGFPASTLSHRVLKLDENGECPILKEVNESTLMRCIDTVCRSAWTSDFETLRRVGIHHMFDKQSRVLIDEEEEDEELVDFDIEWVNPVYVVAEPIAQPGMVVFEQPDDDYVMEELRRIARTGAWWNDQATPTTGGAAAVLPAHRNGEHTGVAVH